MSKKRLLYYIYVLILFASCEKDQDAMLTQLEVMKEQFTPSYTSIVIECQLSSMASIKDVYVQYASSEDFADYQEMQMQKKDGKYHANITDLEDNTIYYIRYSASNRYSNGTTKRISNIKTLTQSPPTIKLISVYDILNEIATAKFEVQHDGGASITQTGICWSMNTNPTIDNTHVESKNQQNTIPISNLQANTTYYLRAYAVNRKGVGYSEQELSFTTLSLPEVQTNEITDIQLTTALLNGNLIFNGNDSTTIKGFCWSEQSAPTINNNQIQVTTNSNDFVYQLSDLKDETMYYVRAYAKNKIGIAYGEEKSFTTTSAIKPTVTTSSITSITYTSAKTGGNVTSDGGAAVTDRGVCYSTSSSPTISNSKVSSGSGTGSFIVNLTGLLDGTTYYVRAYATNKKGTIYGEQKLFTTNAYLKPTVTTSTATNISYTTATIGGNVTSDGGANVTERGVVYSTSQNPTTLNSKKVSGSGTGTFSVNLTGLTNGTTYYARAYAINRKGTSYGQQITLSTQAYAAPSITTSSTTNISYTSATIGGNVTSDGGATVTERGIVYSTSQNPMTSNSKKVSGSGIGTFSVNLTGLTNGTTYYARAYAINSKGTSYGQQVTFATQAYVAPTVTTSSATNISYTSASVSGNVISDGGVAVTERGVVYSTSQYPSISDFKITSGTGVGEFSVNLSNLSEGIVYYVRAFAINTEGVSYGQMVSFKTFKHEYMDLGLSVKWATCNVGAYAPEEQGEYFAWGETKPKDEYTKETYKHYSVSSWNGYTTIWKYNSTDNRTVLDATDDAAAVNWGGTWRMPTKTEQEELMTKCTWEQTSINNVTGCLVTGPNGNSIFLPMARSKGDRYDDTYISGYWSSSLYTSNTMLAYCMSIWTNGPQFWDCKRYMGCPIRPVYP